MLSAYLGIRFCHLTDETSYLSGFLAVIAYVLFVHRQLCFLSQEQNTVLKFSEQMGTPQHVATSSSLTAHLRSFSKGDSPVGSPFQNYSSIHSQSRSVSSPSMQSRSPSISNMAALRWVLNMMHRQMIPKNTSYRIGCTSGIAVCLSLLLQVCLSKVQVPPVLQHLKALLGCLCDTLVCYYPYSTIG